MTPEKKSKAFWKWYQRGIKKGFCSKEFCETHEGYPMHPSEEDAWDQGHDPCAHMVRLGSFDDWDVS